MMTSATDVGQRVWDKSGNEALGGYVAGVLDARDAEIKRLKAELGAADALVDDLLYLHEAGAVRQSDDTLRKLRDFVATRSAAQTGGTSDE